MKVRQSLQAYADQDPPRTAHRGLWLDRFLPYIGKDTEQKKHAKAKHLERACNGQQVPEGYAEFCQARMERLHDRSQTKVFELQTKGRLAIGLGRATPWENNITLHHTWGVPVIPGSSLKGLAASYAQQMLEDAAWNKATKEKPAGDSHKALFGATEERGCVTFHDAIWLGPTSGGPEIGLAMDTITVHHQEYYGGLNAPPADWDSPIPIPLLSIAGRFLFALSGPEVWVDAAHEILELALAEYGVGGKTSSGYGRMSIAPQLSDEELKRKSLLDRIGSFQPPKNKGEASGVGSLLEAIQSSPWPELAMKHFIKLIEKDGAKGGWGICKARVIKRCAEGERYSALRAFLPASWFRPEAAGEQGKTLEELEAELARHRKEKPSKPTDKKDKAGWKRYEKRNKPWKSKHDRLRRQIEKAKSEA